MNLLVNAALLERMAEGVILLNASGQVTDFNAAGRPWLAACGEARASLEKHIKRHAAELADGPCVVDVFGPQAGAGAAVEVHLCSNGPQSYALFIAPPLAAAPAPAVPADKTGFLDLLGEEIRHEITQWRAQLQAGQAGVTDAGLLARHSERLGRLFVVFDQLSRISHDDALGQGERLVLPALLQEVLADMPHRRADYALISAPAGKGRALGVVYGNAGLLKCSLRGLLEALDEGAPKHSQIELQMRQSGAYIMLSTGFATGARRGPRAPAATGAQANEPLRHAPALRTEADIRLPIARRIVALHGGQLKTVDADSARRGGASGLASFTLVLPTGAMLPGGRRLECADCPTAQQAQAYARDLAALMPGPDPGADVSGEELAFLMQVMADKPRK